MKQSYKIKLFSGCSQEELENQVNEFCLENVAGGNLKSIQISECMASDSAGGVEFNCTILVTYLATIKE